MAKNVSPVQNLELKDMALQTDIFLNPLLVSDYKKLHDSLFESTMLKQFPTSRMSRSIYRSKHKQANTIQLPDESILSHGQGVSHMAEETYRVLQSTENTFRAGFDSSIQNSVSA